MDPAALAFLLQQNLLRQEAEAVERREEEERLAQEEMDLDMQALAEYALMRKKEDAALQEADRLPGERRKPRPRRRTTRTSCCSWC